MLKKFVAISMAGPLYLWVPMLYIPPAWYRVIVEILTAIWGLNFFFFLMEPEGSCLYFFFVYLTTLHEALTFVPPLAAFLYQSDNRLVKRKISAPLGDRTTAFQPIFSHVIN